MPELPSDEDNLPAMMRLVRDEIGQHVTYIERQVPPDVCGRGRHLAAGLEAEHEECLDALAAPLEGGEQLAASDVPEVHEHRGRDPVRRAERAEPAGSAVVQVRHEHADGAARGTGDGFTPKWSRQVLDEVRGYLTVGAPGREDGCLEITEVGHGPTP